MKITINYNKIFSYLWVIAGAIIMFGSADQIIKGIKSDQVTILVYKYNVQFYDMEALIMLSGMFIFGSLSFYIGWLKLSKV